MAGGRPKLNLPATTPLQERPAFLGADVRDLFYAVAKKWRIDFLELWGGKQGPCASARREIAVRMHRSGFGTLKIAWAIGWDPSHCSRQLKLAHAERGDPKTLAKELHVSPAKAIEAPVPPEEPGPVEWRTEDPHEEQAAAAQDAVRTLGALTPEVDPFAPLDVGTEAQGDLDG